MSKKKASIGGRVFSGMNYRELQRACVGRGMEFKLVVSGDVLKLHSWLNNHSDNSQNLLLLNEFDDWKQNELMNTGKYEKDSPLFHPDLKLGFIGKRDIDGNIETTKKPRLKGLDKKVKKKKERIEGTKIITGTKKSMTYELAFRGKTVKEVEEAVLEAFPDANPKSLSIWYKRALKELKENPNLKGGKTKKAK